MKLPFTSANSEVLPYQTDSYLHELLTEYSNLLREVVNFGTHLLNWDVEKVREGEDRFLATLYFRNSLELIDGISILIKDCSVDPAKLLCRSLFESNLYLMYLIEKDEELRTSCFMVCKLKNEIKYNKKYISGERSSKDFQSKLRGNPYDFNIEKFLDLDGIQDGIDSSVKVLKKVKYSNVVVEYERTKKRLKNRITWYSLFDGPSDIENLAKHFNLTILYEFQYRNLSKVVHSNHITKGIVGVKGEKDKAQVIQIRDFEDFKMLLENTLNFASMGFTRFVNARIPEHLNKYQDWYRKFKVIKDLILEKEFHYQK